MRKYHTLAQALAAAEKRAEQCRKAPLNNLNSSSGCNLKPTGEIQPTNLNNLKGVPRLQLYTDPALQKAMDWGVEEWLVQICIRDYGLYIVKSQINRIYQIPDSYFKPHYGPIPQQRGRIFNKEMQKLNEANSPIT
jgi:hypothetical protein